ncbi:MAG: hypothetical protein ABIZ91_14820 [Gemmatimonadaceae bacterium]
MKSLKVTAALAALVVMGCATDGSTGLRPDVARSANAELSRPFTARQIAYAVAPTGVTCPAGTIPGLENNSGVGTGLGNYTGQAWTCIAFTSPSTFNFVSSENHVVAANGDELVFTLVHGAGGLRPNRRGLGLYYVIEYDITGGTGRFAGATGRVTVTGGKEIASPVNPSYSDIVGTISLAQY